MDLALLQLAELLRIRNELDARISQLTGRSARPGDVGEFIASRVFDIELAATATQAGYDGRFRSGPLAGRTVEHQDVRGCIRWPGYVGTCMRVLSDP